MEENAYNTLDQAEYCERYTSLVERYEIVKNELVNIDNKRLKRNTKRESIEAFIKTLEKNDNILTEFDEELWSTTVEKVTVSSDYEIAFTFKDGMEL